MGKQIGRDLIGAGHRSWRRTQSAARVLKFIALVLCRPFRSFGFSANENGKDPGLFALFVPGGGLRLVHEFLHCAGRHLAGNAGMALP